MLPVYTNEEMRGGDDIIFVTHAPTMKALGEHNMANVGRHMMNKSGY